MASFNILYALLFTVLPNAESGCTMVGVFIIDDLSNMAHGLFK